MNKVNFKKVGFGVSLGTVMALGSMSSAFAADNNLPTTQATKVHLVPTNPILGNVGTNNPPTTQATKVHLVPTNPILGNVGTSAPLIQNGANGGRVLGNVGTSAPLIQNGANGGRVLGNVGTSPKPNQKQKPNQNKHLLTQEQAKKIALKQYKGTVKDTKLTKENGTVVYVIVIHGQDRKDYTVKMNAVTGEIVNYYSNNDQKGKTNSNNDQKGNSNDVQKGIINTNNAR
jgi:hypothetical protein